jgi:uncharacterized membrane protein YkoI
LTVAISFRFSLRTERGQTERYLAALLLDNIEKWSLYSRMRLISHSALSSVLCLSLQASPLDPKGTAKITRNEAEHIALKQYPGGRVKMAKLETVDGKLVWSIEIANPNSP